MSGDVHRIYKRGEDRGLLREEQKLTGGGHGRKRMRVMMDDG
jgi:hypothetical protein